MWAGDQLGKAPVSEGLGKKCQNQGKRMSACAPTMAVQTCICAFYMFIPRAPECEHWLLKHTVSKELPN